MHYLLKIVIVCLFPVHAVIGEPPHEASVNLDKAVPRISTNTDPHNNPSDIKEENADMAASVHILPIEGDIGIETTLKDVKAALRRIPTSKNKTLVLLIDSPGGNVNEKKEIINALEAARKEQKLRLIALIRPSPKHDSPNYGAFSAAACIAMACPEIYIDPRCSIGAALILHGGRAADATIEGKKFASPDYAFDRETALNAGHSPLIVQAMIRFDAELWRVGIGSSMKLFDSEKDANEYAKTINEKAICLDDATNVLTLTATEAENCGLAKVLNDSVSDQAFSAAKNKLFEDIILKRIGESLGDKGWSHVDMRGRTSYNLKVATLSKNFKVFDNIYSRILDSNKLAQEAYDTYRINKKASFKETEKELKKTSQLLNEAYKILNENEWISKRHGNYIDTINQIKVDLDSMSSNINLWKNQRK